MATLKIGISGWTYPRWRGLFYPQGLAHKNELAFSSRLFGSIEINGSFYSLQRPETYRAWYAQTPPDFIFSLKGSRFITHMKKLKDSRGPLANFFASGPLELREKLGPFLWQLPPQLRFDPARLKEFLDILPRNMREAAELAREHDARVPRSDIDPSLYSPRSRLRHAIEVRHDSFNDEAFIELLRAHQIALCIADTAGRWVFAEDITADFVYVRLHGQNELYAGGYDDETLDWWADRIRHWRKGTHPRGAHLLSPKRAPAGDRDVFVYFDNDAKVRAPFDALALAERFRGRNSSWNPRSTSIHMADRSRGRTSNGPSSKP